MNPIVESLALLTPYDIDIGKRRIGPDADGGYVFADAISAEQAVLSYGIGTEYRFDIAMAEAGHDVYMFDHTIGGIERTHERMLWFREGVAGRPAPERDLYSIDDHLARHDILGDRLIMKMDVEGAEFDALGLSSRDTLERFEQIVVEIHWLGLLGKPEFREGFNRMTRNLNDVFTLFHVHANNYDGPNRFCVLDGIITPNVMELSYIRTSSVTRRPSRTLYPTEFDRANGSQRDKLLWFFPYMPTQSGLADFAACEERLTAPA